MCDAENQQALQRGMNFRLNPSYSVLLMSQRSNAPYKDRIYSDGFSIEYEGHDVSKIGNVIPKNLDQTEKLPSGKLTQNGRFINAVKKFNEGNVKPEPVKVYEKIMDGVWSLKGYFDLIEYRVVRDGDRNVFRFLLRLSNRQFAHDEENNIELNHTRLIPSEVKKEVWKRDGGKCVICESTENLHFDHELPFSKGGTSLTAKNVRLLCMKHNLQKSANIE